MKYAMKLSNMNETKNKSFLTKNFFLFFWIVNEAEKIIIGVCVFFFFLFWLFFLIVLFEFSAELKLKVYAVMIMDSAFGWNGMNRKNKTIYFSSVFFFCCFLFPFWTNNWASNCRQISSYKLRIMRNSLESVTHGTPESIHRARNVRYVHLNMCVIGIVMWLFCRFIFGFV